MTLAVQDRPRVCGESDVPERLNGFRVISHQIHAVCVTVAIERWDHVVIATWWPDLGNTWMWGHYLHGKTGGQQQHEFCLVAARNARRGRSG